MSYHALTYTQVIRLFRQKARSLTMSLPKGTKLISARMLNRFLEEQKETLRKWYGGMLLQVLDEEDFCRLLNSKKKSLYFPGLTKSGLSRDEVKTLRESLFQLLKTILINSSGVGLQHEMKYKVRLYRLADWSQNEEWGFGDGLKEQLPN